jgi:hypothetical protein
MAAFTLLLDVTLDTLFDECVYTQVRLSAYPTTLPLAQDFDNLLTQWATVRDQEKAIDRELVATRALARIVDEELDDLTDETAKTLLLITKGERDDPDYELYFGDTRPSDLKRPLLGAQLDTMRGWVQNMQASSHPQIVDLGKRVAAAVARGDAATANVTAAERKNREFRTTGARRKLIDVMNAVRKSTYGKLAEMPHAQPQLKLPRDFANRFFRTKPSSAPKPRTESDVEDDLALATQRVTDLQTELNDMRKAADEAKIKQENEEKQAAGEELVDAEKEMEELAKRVAALKEKAGK